MGISTYAGKLYNWEAVARIYSSSCSPSINYRGPGEGCCVWRVKKRPPPTENPTTSAKFDRSYRLLIYISKKTKLSVRKVLAVPAWALQQRLDAEIIYQYLWIVIWKGDMSKKVFGWSTIKGYFKMKGGGWWNIGWIQWIEGCRYDFSSFRDRCCLPILHLRQVI